MATNYTPSDFTGAPVSGSWLQNFGYNQNKVDGTNVTADALKSIAGGQTPDVKQKTGLNGALETAGAGMDVLGGLAQIYFSWQANKLAKQNMGFQRDAFNANLGNSVKDFNTNLEDRIRARYHTEGRSGEADAYIAKNSLENKQV